MASEERDFLRENTYSWFTFATSADKVHVTVHQTMQLDTCVASKIFLT